MNLIESIPVWIIIFRIDKDYTSQHYIFIVAYKINQQDATVFQVYYLTFICGSTCFGRHTTVHQKRTTAAFGFCIRCRLKDITLLVVVGQNFALMIGGMAPETCSATNKRQVINLEDCCILLVDFLKKITPGFTDPKTSFVMLFSKATCFNWK
jgi:hypothetical protein